MKKIYIYSLIIFVGVLLLLLAACGSHSDWRKRTFEKTQGSTRVAGIEAENFLESSTDVAVVNRKSEGFSVHSETKGWLKYEINIPAPGRYQSQIHLAPGSKEGTICWIEDYCDNKHNRIFDITGNMRVGGVETEGAMITKDGSPLDKGRHKMKVHFDGSVNIDRIAFTLMKPYRETAHVMKQRMDGDRWQVVWEDDFNQTAIDTARWTFDIGDWGWGNDEIQYYTDNDPNNAYIENGNLILAAKKERSGNGWTSARITTREKVSFLYGKIEFRAKVPSARGNWAAGWTLGDTYVDEFSWPSCGRIDILESVGYEMDDRTGRGIAHASAHCGAYYFKLGNQRTGIIDVENMNTEYHTYSVEWTPSNISAFVDDRHYITYNEDSTDLSWPFDKPQNIILNLAMGGGWGGYFGIDESITSLKLIVDYVRVYELQ